MNLQTYYEVGHKQQVTLVENQSMQYRSFCNTFDASTLHLASEYHLSDAVEFEAGVRSMRAESSTQSEYSMLPIQLRVRRRPIYWLMNLFLPLFVIVGSAFSSFFVPRVKLADRCGVTVTLLLALVTFKLVVVSLHTTSPPPLVPSYRCSPPLIPAQADKLPKLSYLTIVDAYILLCFAVVAAIIVVQTLSAIDAIPEPGLVRQLTSAAGVVDVVELPWYGIIGFACWVLPHALAAAALTCCWRDQLSWQSYASDAERALYIKPNTTAADPSAALMRVLQRELAAAHVPMEVLNGLDLHPWTPEEVSKAFKKAKRKLPFQVHSKFWPHPHPNPTLTPRPT
jgi:hypothetical protein